MHLNNKMFSKKLFKKISPVLKEINSDAFMFFDDLFEIYTPKETRENCFNDSNYHNKALKNFNVYLKNENTYNKLRNIISEIDLNFINQNIINTNLENKYDFIILSTLFNEISFRKFINLIKRLNNCLSDDGLIMLAYLWNNNIYTHDYATIWKRIYQNPEANKYLKKYLTDIYEVSGYINYLWENSKREDKVLVYRKNS